jgi:hypothetical protein
MKDSVDLNPIVYWITRESDATHTDNLRDLVRSFRGRAKNLLLKHAPPERSGRDADSLVYLALFSLQCKILNQYLPALKPQKNKSISCLWPSWNETGMKVLLDTGNVHTLRPLPEGNGVVQHLTLPDGRDYVYTFYRNDSVEQRRKWLYQALEDEARGEKRALGREIQIEENAVQIDTTPPVFAALDRKNHLKELLSITDSADWKLLLGNGLGDPADRKRRQRAKDRLLVADRILTRSPEDPVAQTYVERLRKAEDGERKPILNEYSNRYSKIIAKSGGETPCD